MKVHPIPGRGFDSNMYVVEGERAILVDAGTGQFGEEKLGQLKSLECASRLERLVLTHRHCDHAGGAAFLAEALGLELLAPPLEAEALRAADVSTGFPADHPGVRVTFPVPTPRKCNRPDPGGHLAYGGPAPTAPTITLVGQGSPKPGGSVRYVINKAPPTTPGFLAVSPAPQVTHIENLGLLLVHLNAMVLFPFVSNALGSAAQDFPIPNAPSLNGATFFIQAYCASGSAGGLSDGVMTRIGQ